MFAQPPEKHMNYLVSAAMVMLRLPGADGGPFCSSRRRMADNPLSQNPHSTKFSLLAPLGSHQPRPENYYFCVL
jgi:hypothetical protein